MKLKMFTAERLSIILLAIALIIWAIVLLLRRDTPNSSEQDAIPVPSATIISADSLSAAQADSILPIKEKKKKNTKSKPSKKANHSVIHRDHLNEPVTLE